MNRHEHNNLVLRADELRRTVIDRAAEYIGRIHQARVDVGEQADLEFVCLEHEAGRAYMNAAYSAREILKEIRDRDRFSQLFRTYARLDQALLDSDTLIGEALTRRGHKPIGWPKT